ncbi:N5-carboxyaminoimidazole ribonucleotide synthase [Iodidimonas gelatinilytica]|uniref:N5-carboxyaminoimidazole ribonucleotide synthase n=1 Tax=Iodidimonas gelatinilytica TaxID=1236966 RepID=A0A5A7N2C4_9PROT|nr:5-(carboxyamino)imidazole ribonucleotide synthase [Iodidimonas gelatinilytica]GER01825.1 N5-carboxyaminoimidazole ribonucleotide synthase [Iodidimonas gelatinilytica]
MTGRSERAETFESLAPGGTIGILGGGQLGRMLSIAAAQLGYRTAIYCPDPLSPAFQMCDRYWQAPYESRAALAEFADAVDLISFEFENVPALSLDFLKARVPIRPGIASLATTQDRLFEKDFLSVLDIPVAPYHDVASAAALHDAAQTLGYPVIAKTRRLGYDGKGQVRLEKGDNAQDAWDSLASELVIAESVIPFDREISVLLARGLDGNIASWPPVENDHSKGILRTSRVPATISDSVADQALSYAHAIAEALDFVGVLAVEMFVTDKTGEVLVNEVAPRVHNSGHWTLDGAVTSQFEQHIRAICGLPLGDSRALGRIRMENLIGKDITHWRDILGDPLAHFHHYGKAVAKPGRKMGHVTWVDPD